MQASEQQPVEVDPLVGQQLDRYRLLRFLGEGRMGAVYAAWDLTLERKVAIKLLPIHCVSAGRESLVAEARLAASLDHENIIRVYEAGCKDGWFYIVMELVEGYDLRKLLHATGEFDQVRACQIMSDVAEALAHAHRMGVIHRDIKPANLILTRSGRCKITDFGLATYTESGRPGGPLHARRAGTPMYMAPEVAAGQPSTARSDLYSLGATMWHLLTGAPPLPGGGDGPFEGTARSRPTLDLRELRPDLSAPLVEAVESALAPDPAERLQDAEQFAQVLRVCSIPAELWDPDTPEGKRFSAAMTRVLQQTSARPWWSRSSGLFIAATVSALIGTGSVLGLYGLEVWMRRQAVAQMQHPGTPPVFTRFDANDAVHGLQWLSIQPRRSLNGLDEPELRRLMAADDRTVYSIEGEVLSISEADSGRIAWLRLRNTDAPDLALPFFSETFDAMRQAFGHDGLDRLIGRRVCIKGHLTQYEGRPQIIIETPLQVRLIEVAAPTSAHAAAPSAPDVPTPGG